MEKTKPKSEDTEVAEDTETLGIRALAPWPPLFGKSWRRETILHTSSAEERR